MRGKKPIRTLIPTIRSRQLSGQTARPGHLRRGTCENDRSPTLGLVGRTSGELRLIVCPDTQQTTITPKVKAYTEPVAVPYTDGSSAYGRIEETGRTPQSVDHSEGEWARDADGDGLREVHSNTIESGRGCEIFCVALAGFTRSIWPSTWPSSSGNTTSKR
jgi:hypothetical protein